MSVEYREEPCRSALNRVQGMPFKWSLNPYMGCVHRCTFCYVRAFEKRADRPSDDRYGTSIRVKTNVAEVLRKELARPSWESEGIAIGAATDPYQPAEGRYKLTRACLEVLRDAANPFSIITRGPMIVRDVDILCEAARRADVSVTFSIPTLDVDIWRQTEPGTAPPHQRLRALQELVEAGIRVGVGMAPILPGLSDKPELMEDVVRAARAAGACGVWANLLYLKPGTKEHYLRALERDWPELLPEYEQLYGRRAYADASQVRAQVRELARAHGIRDRRRRPLEPPAEPEQLRLAVYSSSASFLGGHGVALAEADALNAPRGGDVEPEHPVRRVCPSEVVQPDAARIERMDPGETRAVRSLQRRERRTDPDARGCADTPGEPRGAPAPVLEED
jgi:DNA repair photolyase